MSKTNIKMGKPVYIVKPDDGIIVCKITTCGCDDNFPYLDLWSVKLSKKLQKRYGISCMQRSIEFTAVARLHKQDTWDEVIGKRIAESKCKRNIYSFYLRMYDFIINEIIHNDIALFNQYTDNLMYCVHREAKHLKELTGNED